MAMNAIMSDKEFMFVHLLQMSVLKNGVIGINNMKGHQIAGTSVTRKRVENDFYATPSESTKAILDKEKLFGSILEPACGNGAISKEIIEKYPQIELYSCDLIDRGYGLPRNSDFFKSEMTQNSVDIVITNPPFSLFQEFAEKALEIVRDRVILFGKLQALEGQKRATFLQNSPLRTVYVFKARQNPLRNGSAVDENGKPWANTMAFAWFVWEIGYTGKPTIEWL